MRIITGTAKGIKLNTLDGEHTRPTAERTKEAIFSALQFDMDGRAVLDLFAGSGQMGIEALSRGAKQAIFIDSAKKSVEVVKRNLKATKLEENARVLQTDFRSFLASHSAQFDIAFLDPPYRTGLLQEALPLTAGVMKDTGIIIAENPLEEPLGEQYGDFVLDRQYRYGKIRITTYRHKDYL